MITRSEEVRLQRQIEAKEREWREAQLQAAATQRLRQIEVSIFLM